VREVSEEEYEEEIRRQRDARFTYWFLNKLNKLKRVHVGYHGRGVIEYAILFLTATSIAFIFCRSHPWVLVISFGLGFLGVMRYLFWMERALKRRNKR